MNKIINSTNLTKVYGEKETSVTALDNINIEFKENEFTAIMGPSGSGKSTLLHCLAGLDRPTSGQIFLKGNVVITSYTIPWIVDYGIKIWLDGSLENSAKRMTARDNVSVEKSSEIAKTRYDENKIIYKELYGFEFGKDLSVFHKIVKTDGLNASEVLKITISAIKELL